MEEVEDFLQERTIFESWMIQKLAGLQILVECLVDGRCYPDCKKED